MALAVVVKSCCANYYAGLCYGLDGVCCAGRMLIEATTLWALNQEKLCCATLDVLRKISCRPETTAAVTLWALQHQGCLCHVTLDVLTEFMAARFNCGCGRVVYKKAGVFGVL
jgi:hypothetical protein